MHVEAIYISPVKSLALQRVDRATVAADGIAGDRRFFLVNERGRLVSQRECGALVQVRATYTAEPKELRLEFPDGGAVAGTPEDGEPLTVRFFGQVDVEGYVVEGKWSQALSEYVGKPVQLVRAAATAFDDSPISICSTASVQALRAASGVEAIDQRRFRPNFYVSAGKAHVEDEWIGHSVCIGGAVVRVAARDSRCEITTHSPDSGEIDVNTLKLIAAYRTDQPKEVNFGVYGTVEQPGEVAVGDAVEPLGEDTRT